MYQRLIGRLIYLNHTRPDIGFSVIMVSRCMNDPKETNMKAVNRIRQYLKKASGKGLHFKKNTSRKIEIFIDADWVGSVIDRRSTNGYCPFVWDNFVTWRSKKQYVVARSIVEAEFRLMTHGICEGMLLERMLMELQVHTYHKVSLLCDKKAAISIVKNHVQHNGTKHIKIDRYFIKENIGNGLIYLQHTPSSHQTYILTKTLPRANYEKLRFNLGMIDIYDLRVCHL